MTGSPTRTGTIWLSLGMTGSLASLKSVTLTPEVKINKNLFVRWDLRHDFSDQKVFEKEGTPKDNQTTLAMNAGIVF